MDKNEVFIKMMDLSASEKDSLLKLAFNLFEDMNDDNSRHFFIAVDTAIRFGRYGL